MKILKSSKSIKKIFVNNNTDTDTNEINIFI